LDDEYRRKLCQTSGGITAINTQTKQDSDLVQQHGMAADLYFTKLYLFTDAC